MCGGDGTARRGCLGVTEGGYCLRDCERGCHDGVSPEGVTAGSPMDGMTDEEGTRLSLKSR